jgi:hypothetical protein
MHSLDSSLFFKDSALPWLWQVWSKWMEWRKVNFFGGKAVLGFELRASHLLGRHSTTWAILWTLRIEKGSWPIQRWLTLSFTLPPPHRFQYNYYQKVLPWSWLSSLAPNLKEPTKLSLWPNNAGRNTAWRCIPWGLFSNTKDRLSSLYLLKLTICYLLNITGKLKRHKQCFLFWRHLQFC